LEKVPAEEGSAQRAKYMMKLFPPRTPEHQPPELARQMVEGHNQLKQYYCRLNLALAQYR
jgi:hypothetical protein